MFKPPLLAGSAKILALLPHELPTFVCGSELFRLREFAMLELAGVLLRDIGQNRQLA